MSRSFPEHPSRDAFRQSTPLGRQSIFQSSNFCGAFDTAAYKGVVDQQRLLLFLQRGDRIEFFDQADFHSNQTELSYPPSSGGNYSSSAAIITPVHTPFSYEDQGQQQTAIFDRVVLNNRICWVDKTPAYHVVFDLAKQQAEYGVLFYYNDTVTKRKNIDHTLVEGTAFFEQDAQYRAIGLYTGDFEVFMNFVQALSIPNPRGLKSGLIQRFKIAYQQLNRANLAQVDWLYTHLSAFFLQELSLTQRWEDLQGLMQHQEQRWWGDSSSILIKLLRSFLEDPEDATFLYQQLYAQPAWVKRLYEQLDGTSEHDGQRLPNASIFASLLTTIVYRAFASRKQPLTTEVSFSIGERARVDSNIWQEDTVEGQYNLTQETLQWTQKINERTGISYPPSWSWEVAGPTHHLHPLELVTLTMPYQNGKTLTLPLPAIFVKDLAQQQEWATIEPLIRVGTDVLAVVTGVAGLFSGNPLLVTLAAAELGLAVVDLGALAFEEQLQRSEWGRQFLAAWEDIYQIGGIALAVVSAPDLVRSMVGFAGRALRTVAGQARTVLKQVLTKTILEWHIAQGRFLTRLEVGVEVVYNVTSRLRRSAADRLADQGVVFVRGYDEGGALGYSAWYKGEEIVSQRDVKGLYYELKDVLTTRKSKLETALDHKASKVRRKRKIDEYREVIASEGSIKLFTQEEIITALRGITTHADEVADLLESRVINYKILKDTKFEEKLVQSGDSLEEARKTAAVYLEDIVFFRSSASKEDFFNDLIHEGSHVIDDELIKKMEIEGASDLEIEQRIGNNWEQEIRAYTKERAFQLAVGLEPRFETLEEIIEYVKDKYDKY